MWTSASSTGSRAARLIHIGRALARNGLREIAVRELKARGARAGKAEIRAGWWWRCWVFSRLRGRQRARSMGTTEMSRARRSTVWWLQEGEARGGAVHGTEIGGEADGYRKPQEKDK